MFYNTFTALYAFGILQLFVSFQVMRVLQNYLKQPTKFNMASTKVSQSTMLQDSWKENRKIKNNYN